MNNKAREMDYDEYIKAAVDWAKISLPRVEGKTQPLGGWRRLCAQSRPKDIDAAFWEGFVIGGALMGMWLLEREEGL
ncbi:MAG: hypothetical protein GX256_03325 [Fretibacterium sp.]|nr:hypothetical protein [Fretibacterium sp.]